MKTNTPPRPFETTTVQLSAPSVRFSRFSIIFTNLENDRYEWYPSLCLLKPWRCPPLVPSPPGSTLPWLVPSKSTWQLTLTPPWSDPWPRGCRISHLTSIELKNLNIQSLFIFKQKVTITVGDRLISKRRWTMSTVCQSRPTLKNVLSTGTKSQMAPVNNRLE